MTETRATKKNPNYESSAVNLCNPPEVRNDLLTLVDMRNDLAVLQTERDNLIPQELKDRIEICQKYITEQDQVLRIAIDEFGSFQDVESGQYAVKQRKVSRSYKAEPFEKSYPQFAPAVIIKAVDTIKIHGLIKGGLLNEPDLERDGVLVCTESFSYIIKV